MGVGNGLSLGRLPDQHFAILRKGHNRWRGPVAFTVFDDLGRTAVHDCDTGVGCAQINSDNICHAIFLEILLDDLGSMFQKWGWPVIFSTFSSSFSG